MIRPQVRTGTVIAFAVLAFALGLPAWLAGQARDDAGPAKTLSPFFYVKGEDTGLDALPLKSTRADVRISGVIADVVVTQVYTNEGQRPLEAVYIFPASTRAAVYGMTMTIGERVIQAQIREKKQARREYEQARSEGKTASLLEQMRPNVFQMNVANILPGDEIRVELRYTELLVPEAGVYTFVYPTVVGPRYSNRPEEGAAEGDKWVQNPYFHAGVKPSATFDIGVELAAGMPIRELSCRTHPVRVQYRGRDLADVVLDGSDLQTGNRDYILRYRLSSDRVEPGLLLYRGEEENFFLLMVQPPRRVAPADIPPREYIFIMDVSGSMYGFPLDRSKEVLRQIIGGLRPQDAFNVLLFAGDSATLAPVSLPGSPENIRRAMALIDSQRGGGGTELLPALEKALALPRAEKTARSVVILTDGYVDVEKEAFDLIRQNLGEANLFAFGIGTSVNRYLIEGMARAGAGEPFIVTNSSDAEATVARFTRYIGTPALTRIRLSFEKFGAYDVEPIQVPDVLAERPVVIFGKWRGESRGAIRLTGFTGTERYDVSIPVDPDRVDPENAALRYLWARHRLAVLADDQGAAPDPARVLRITELGLRYNLLTEYTSFVAVEHVVRRKTDDLAAVKQPLPLPEGVSDLAVGGTEIPTTPEPETWALIGIALAVLVWVGLHRKLA
jgi:Ca-activated chloride channel family protein